jgi:hypothetical protein
VSRSAIDKDLGCNKLDGCDVSGIIGPYDIDSSGAWASNENVNIQKLPKSLTTSTVDGALG